MEATPLGSAQLLLFIVGISVALCAFVAFMFRRFVRFLNREKARGEAFRAVHKDDKP